MTTEQRHRCGGTLWPRQVQILDERAGIVFMHVVPGLVCDGCHEELIEREALLVLEKSGTPAAILFRLDRVPSTSVLKEPILAKAPSSSLVAA
jgi:hypothetical protein